VNPAKKTPEIRGFSDFLTKAKCPRRKILSASGRQMLVSNTVALADPLDATSVRYSRQLKEAGRQSCVGVTAIVNRDQTT